MRQMTPQTVPDQDRLVHDKILGSQAGMAGLANLRDVSDVDCLGVSPMAGGAVAVGKGLVLVQ